MYVCMYVVSLERHRIGAVGGVSGVLDGARQQTLLGGYDELRIRRE